jgi:hypothetical protein
MDAEYYVTDKTGKTQSTLHSGPLALLAVIMSLVSAGGTDRKRMILLIPRQRVDASTYIRQISLTCTDLSKLQENDAI